MHHYSPCNASVPALWGFTEVSMQQIAEAANLRKASIYHHFPSKVDLFVAVTKREIDALYEQTTLAVATSDDLVPQLRAIARVWPPNRTAFL